MMPKLFLCGITQNQKQNIDELTKDVYKLFDGLIFVDHFSKDGTSEILAFRRGLGEIIQRPWRQAHDHSMNEFLYAGIMKEGDWFVLRDSSERLNPEWVAQIKSTLIPELEKRQCDTLYQRGKVLLARYHFDLFFYGTPHWGLQGQKTKAIDVGTNDESNDIKYAYSTRNLRTKEEWIRQDIKYLLYARSNQNALVFKSLDTFKHYESRRKALRDHCLDSGIGVSVESLITHFKTVPKLETIFLDECKDHILWRNFYRFYRLGHSGDEIEKTQDKWQLTEEFVK
jgi:glycosyltransferase involved in cell wall biosynthesis